MKELHLDFGHFELHKDYILGTINEGVHFDLELNKILGENLIAHYGTKDPVAYISNRIHHYSVDPMVYKFNSSYDCLKAIAIVESPEHILKTTDIESRFFKPQRLRAFTDTKDAYNWCQSFLSFSFS